MKRIKTVSINLRLPANLHKKLVEAAASTSPPQSLNSEILARLFESFDRPTEAEIQELEGKVRQAEAYALTRMKEVEQVAVARMREVEQRADELTKEMESALAKTLELHRRAEAKLR
jgi:hypothetical protein